MLTIRRIRVLLLPLLPLLVAGGRPATAQAVDVTADIHLNPPSLSKSSGKMNPVQVVVWLTPLDPAALKAVPGRFRMAQKDKMFQPHLLVVPVGSTVSFPNLDPFFHNVFSLFNGKRFDLGLYEAGTTRDVVFNNEGISYIFCNIHPEMSAVVISLATPYYASSPGNRKLTLRSVPPGAYRMSLWAEGLNLGQLSRLSRTVEISADNKSLGVIAITRDAAPQSHANKFGQPYAEFKDQPY
jgi:plastocyanin